MKISVIIPVYNAEKFLKRCLESIINQTYSEWEVIAIDDGSRDNSYSILQDYSNRDSRFKIYTQSNKGPGLTRNKALEFVTGDYIVFIDSDDYIEPNYFEDLVSCIVEEEPDVVFIDVIQESPVGDLIKYELASKYKGYPKDTIIKHQITGKLPWGAWRKAVRSSLIIDGTIRFSPDPVGEEALYSFKLLRKASRISFLNKPYYHYVNHRNSQSKKGEDDPWGQVCMKMKDYFNECGLSGAYRETINSFGFTAMIVSINRIANNYHIKEALKKSKERFAAFKYLYCFDLDLDSLETRVRCLVPIAKCGLVFLIVIAAKLKKYYDSFKIFKGRNTG